MGKSTQLPFTCREITASHPLALLHLDVWGPAPTLSISDARFYLAIVDDCTRYTRIFLLNRKFDVFHVFQNFHRMIENLLSLRVKTLQSDGGGEFVNNQFSSYLQTCGISHHISCPFTTQ